MAKIRVNRVDNFTIMSNIPLRNKEMSLKAKGLLAVMMSLPDNWDYSVNGLVAICKENVSAINSTLKELKQFGYLKVTKEMPSKENGGRIDYIYDIYPEPQSDIIEDYDSQQEEKQEQEKQGVENLGVEFLGIENQGQLRKEEQRKENKENNNKEKSIKRFVRPTVEEIEAYCFERNNSINAQYFFDYYEARGWEYKGGTKIKDWKACIRTWENNERKTPKQKPMSQFDYLMSQMDKE